MALFPEGRPMEVMKAQPDPKVPGAFWCWRELPGTAKRTDIKWIPPMGGPRAV